VNPFRLVPTPNEDPPQRLEVIEPAFGVDMAPVRYIEIVEGGMSAPSKAADAALRKVSRSLKAREHPAPKPVKKGKR